MENEISLTEALKKAWQITAKNWLVLVGLTTAFLALVFLTDFLLSGKQAITAQNPIHQVEYIKEMFTCTQILRLIISLIVGCIFSYVFYSAILDCVQGIEPQFKFSLRKILNLAFTQIILAVLVFCSIALLSLLMLSSLTFFFWGYSFWFIALIYFSIRFQFFAIIIIDKDSSPVEALKKSWNLTKRNKVKCLLLILLQIALCFAGFIALGIGILYAIPLIYVLQVCFYEQLQNNSERNLQETNFLS